jgi:hypothetical protein
LRGLKNAIAEYRAGRRIRRGARLSVWRACRILSRCVAAIIAAAGFSPAMIYAGRCSRSSPRPDADWLSSSKQNSRLTKPG